MTILYYRQDLINRFWEERRQANANAAFLFDVVKTLIHLSPDGPNKQRWATELSTIQNVRIGNAELSIPELDMLTIRIQSQPLTVQLDYGKTLITPKEIIVAEGRLISELGRIISEIADKYSPEVMLNDDSEVAKWE